MAIFSVIFDLDGLMVDTERMALAAWRRALADYGLSLADADYLRMVGRPTRDTQPIMEEIFGSSLTFSDLIARRQTYYEEDVMTNGVPVKPGLMELLAFLEERNIPKGVASSSAIRSVRLRLARAGIEERFAVLVGGDQVVHAKPAPDLFLAAARGLGAAPEQCVALEDSLMGIRAAYDAGMLPLMVPDLVPPGPETDRMAYRVLPSLYEVIPVLGEFLENGLPRQ